MGELRKPLYKVFKRHRLIVQRLEKLRQKFKTSLGKSLSANFLNQLSSVLIQIVGVPILISSLGVAQYGEYLALSALPTFLFFADLGLGVSLSNQMTIFYSAGKRKLTQWYANSLVVFTIALVSVLMLVGLLFFLVDVRQLFNFHTYSNRYYQSVFYILLLIALLYNISGMIAFFLRAVGENAMGVKLSLIHRVVATIAFWVAAVVTKNMLYSAAASLIASLILIFLFFSYYHKNYAHRLLIKISTGSKKLLLKSVKPGLAYLLFPVGNSILNQGVLLIISRAIGAPAVVLFSTVRTLTNVSRQMTGLVNNSVWPELSIAYGARNFIRLKKLITRTIQFSVGSGLIVMVSLWVIGPFIFQAWVGAKLQFNYKFFFLMAIPAFFYAIWSSATVLPFALNKFEVPGVIFLAINLFAILSVIVFSHFSKLTLDVIAIVLISIDALLCLTLVGYLRKVKNQLN